MAYKDKNQAVAYNNNYNRRTYDRLSVNPTKEEGQRIREHAAAAGESVQGYILDAVRERMDREDQEKAQTERPRTDEEEDRDGIL